MGKFIRNISIFLVFMLILTVVSQIVADKLILRVSCENPAGRSVYGVYFDLCVPSGAVGYDGLVNYVYIVIEKDTVIGQETVIKKVPVKIAGTENGVAALMDTELKKDDLVVISPDIGGLSEGDKVIYENR